MGLTRFNWLDFVRSGSGLGVSGVMLVTLNIAAGLGICAFLGLAFNVATSQIAPLLALGLGMNSIFLMTQTYSEIAFSTPILAVPKEVSQSSAKSTFFT